VYYTEEQNTTDILYIHPVAATYGKTRCQHKIKGFIYFGRKKNSEGIRSTILAM
jgi:hypothetical protein